MISPSAQTSKIVAAMFIVLLGCLSLTAQDPRVSEPVNPCNLQSSKNPKRKAPIFSFGVVNGRALYLPKPEYPKAALEFKVSGKVQVNVIIDECGVVQEATATSGHPFLRASAVAAAKRSLFEPMEIGGQPYRVSGVITYNFLANQLNWLELGLDSDSYENLIIFLPAGFDRERKLLQQSVDQPYVDKQLMLKQVCDSIKTSLTTDPKSLWLFTLGRKLNGVSHYEWGTGGRDQFIKEISELIDASPADVSPLLKVRLREWANEPNVETFWKRLTDIEDRLFDFGN